jgi:hypothetical protein
VIPQTPSPKELEARLKLYRDFDTYSALCLKIRPKTGDVVPLELNTAQRILHEAVEKQRAETGRVRVVILKGRQQGLSTYVEGRGYWKVSQRRGFKALVMTHKSDATTTLFEMTKRYHDHVPKLVKPSTRYSSKTELKFDKLDSGFIVATAGGTGIARGETLQYLHASEVAFWPPNTAAEIWNGLEQAVPPADDTEIFVESTACGVSGVFYNLWKGAEAGENGFIAVFIPWFVQPEYRDVVPAGFTHTPDEEDLIKRFGLDDAQLAWRRKKIAGTGIDLFRQEYPCYPEEAFLTTGRPIFNPEVVQQMIKDAVPSLCRMALDTDRWNENPRGELEVWAHPEAGKDYFIGADVSAGVGRLTPDGKALGGDPSVAIVQDGHKRVVARWRGFVDPDYFATILYHLGLLYNFAFICPENNGHGILTVTRLAKDMAYPNVYQTTHYDKVVDKETIKLGFSTTVSTKPLIIDELRAEIREGKITCNDKITLGEMLTFILTETGAMEAEKGCHDDCVMALALCTHVNTGVYTPIINQDDWYTTPL